MLEVAESVPLECYLSGAALRGHGSPCSVVVWKKGFLVVYMAQICDVWLLLVCMRSYICVLDLSGVGDGEILEVELVVPVTGVIQVVGGRSGLG